MKQNKPPEADKEKLVCVKELAKLLGIREGWVRQNMKRIPHLKFGRLVRFELAEVMESFKKR